MKKLELKQLNIQELNIADMKKENGGHCCCNIKLPRVLSPATVMAPSILMTSLTSSKSKTQTNPTTSLPQD